MFKLKFILTFFILISLVYGVSAKKEKVDQILIVQQLISQAYELGYADAAPVEMSFVEKKVIAAKAARDSRKKKLLAKLITQVKLDLKIVKKRFEVNELHKQLLSLQQQNLQSAKTLDELKRQL